MFGLIIQKTDGSFVINADSSFPYHVPNSGEWATLWAEVSAYASEHPDKVKAENAKTPTLEELRGKKQAEIIAYYDDIMSVTKRGYSQAEIDTWETQVSGANDILAGDTSTEAAQFVVALAAARQAAGDTEMTTEYLAQRIKANAAAAAALQVPVMGKQSAEWAAADKATTQEELDAIVPYFDLPAFMAAQEA